MFKELSPYKIVFKDDTYIRFGNGSIDNYAVIYVKNRKSNFYKDRCYFKKIKKLANKYGVEKVWVDFEKIADVVKYRIDVKDIALIEKISMSYDKSFKVFKLFCYLYMTMIAEECKANAILGKDIKRLGIYNILFDNMSILKVTTYMKGVDYKTLRKEMIEKGLINVKVVGGCNE